MAQGCVGAICKSQAFQLVQLKKTTTRSQVFRFWSLFRICLCGSRSVSEVGQIVRVSTIHLLYVGIENGIPATEHPFLSVLSVSLLMNRFIFLPSGLFLILCLCASSRTRLSQTFSWSKTQQQSASNDSWSFTWSCPNLHLRSFNCPLWAQRFMLCFSCVVSCVGCYAPFLWSTL